MKNLIIGGSVIVLILIASFALTNKKEVVVIERETIVQEVSNKISPKVQQEYAPPVRGEYVPERVVVAPDPAVISVPNPSIAIPSVPVIPADMTPPQPAAPQRVSIPAKSQQKGALVDYTKPADLADLKGANILFFKASWCITCTMLYDKLTEEEGDIPAGVTIWVVDYDSNESMRRSYGVTSQHTLVQIDKNRNKINLWRGGFSLAEVLSNIK